MIFHVSITEKDQVGQLAHVSDLMYHWISDSTFVSIIFLCCAGLNFLQLSINLCICNLLLFVQRLVISGGGGELSILQAGVGRQLREHPT